MTPTFIYLIESDIGRVKIGYGQKVRDRVQATRVHSPVLTRLIAQWPGVEADETALHDRFVAYRHHGEWFDIRGDVLAFVESKRGLGVENIPAWTDLTFFCREEFRQSLALAARFGKPKARPARALKSVDTRAGLTRGQRRALQIIKAYVVKHSYSPSYQELADALGLVSKSGVHRYVHGLVERGHISLIAGAHRAIALCEPAARSSRPAPEPARASA